MLKVRSDRVMWERSEDEVVCLDLERSVYFSLNGSGAFLWELLVEGSETDGLVRALAQRFDVPSEQAEADVAEFVHHLAERGLVAPI